MESYYMESSLYIKLGIGRSKIGDEEYFGM